MPRHSSSYDGQTAPLFSWHKVSTTTLMSLWYLCQRFRDHLIERLAAWFQVCLLQPWLLCPCSHHWKSLVWSQGKLVGLGFCPILFTWFILSQGSHHSYAQVVRSLLLDPAGISSCFPLKKKHSIFTKGQNWFGHYWSPHIFIFKLFSIQGFQKLRCILEMTLQKIMKQSANVASLADPGGICWSSQCW